MDDKKWIKKGYLSMCTVIFPYVLWQYFTTSCLILFITKFFFCLFYFIHFFLLFYHKLFLCVSFIEKVSLESKKRICSTWEELERVLHKEKNVSLLYFLSPFNCLCCSRGKVFCFCCNKVGLTYRCGLCMDSFWP